MPQYKLHNVQYAQHDTILSEIKNLWRDDIIVVTLVLLKVVILILSARTPALIGCQFKTAQIRMNYYLYSKRGSNSVETKLQLALCCTVFPLCLHCLLFMSRI